MSPTHWLIVIGVLVLLFGAKKLPDMARSVGQSTRLFKGEMKGLREDDPTDGTGAGQAPAEPARPAGAVPPVGATPPAGTSAQSGPGLDTASATTTGSPPD